MVQKILNYSISLALCLLLSLPLQAQNSNISAPPATTPPKTEKKASPSAQIYGVPEANCLEVTFSVAR